MEAWVSRADGEAPTVPRWNAAKMPLSNRVCEEIVDFRDGLREVAEAGQATPDLRERAVEWVEKRLDCGRANAEVIWTIHAAQIALSEIPTADFLHDLRPCLDEMASRVRG